MKLREIKTKTTHCFIDEQDRFQGEYKYWHDNGQLSSVCYFRDGRFHGECKRWSSDGKLCAHALEIDGTEAIDFLKNPELYPSTPEGKTYFALKYAGAPLIREGDDE